MNSIGKRIRYYRNKAGLTQKEFADKISVCPQAVSKWENDHSLPDLPTIVRISSVLKVTCDTLIADQND